MRALLAVAVVVAVLTGAASADGAIGLRWEDRVHPTASEAIAKDIALDGATVVSSGWVQDDATSFDWIVRAYDTGDGRVLWEDRFDRASGEEYVFGLDARGGRTFAAGLSVDSTSADWHVRAYDTRTGTLLWEDVFDGAGEFDSARALVADSNAVYVAGGTTDALGIGSLLVRAYDPSSGALLWASGHAAGPADVFSGLAVDGGRLFYATSSTLHGALPALNADAHLLAFDTGTGALLWESRFDRRTSDDIFSVAAADGRVFTTHTSCQSELYLFMIECDFRVRAQDASTGAVVWEDAIDPLAADAMASALAVDDGMVFVSGQVGEYCLVLGAGCDLIVRSYDAATGALRWEDRPISAGSDVSEALTTFGGSLYVGVETQAPRRIRVRSYDARTGALRSEDLASSPGDDGFVWDMAADADQIYLSGFGEHGGHIDFAVRAFGVPAA